MPHPPSAQTLAAAYYALVHALTPEHVTLLADFLILLQRSTLKEMNALVAETAHDTAHDITTLRPTRREA